VRSKIHGICEEELRNFCLYAVSRVRTGQGLSASAKPLLRCMQLQLTSTTASLSIFINKVAALQERTGDLVV
jgi:hypothetical protein